MSYDDGRSKAYHHGAPTTSDTSNSSFMEGYRAEQARQEFWQRQNSNPGPFQPTVDRTTGATEPSGPLTLVSAVQSCVVLGLVLCVGYAFLTDRNVFQFALVGLAGGVASGVALYTLAIVLRGVFWLLGWVIRIGIGLAVVWIVCRYLLHIV